MKLKSILGVAVLAATSAIAVRSFGQSAPVPGTRQTTLRIEFNVPDSAVPPISHVTVPTGEFVIVEGTPAFPSVTALQWLRNGQPIANELGSRLLLPNVTAADAGEYTVRLTLADGKTAKPQTLALGVAAAERIVNLSTWSTLRDGRGEGLISGFVVTGAVDKRMLVRAIGPSLAQFGFAHVLQHPVLRIRDASGKLYERTFNYPVPGDLTYDRDLADATSKTGAFATSPNAADAVRLLPVAPGGYTIEVVSGDEIGGSVLLEIYEVP